MSIFFRTFAPDFNTAIRIMLKNILAITGKHSL